MILHGFAWISSRNTALRSKNLKFIQKYSRNQKRYVNKSGFKIKFLTKFLNDSAWFLLEKLKKHVILTKNLNI